MPTLSNPLERTPGVWSERTLIISNVMWSEWKTFYRKMHSLPSLSLSPSQTAVIVSLRSRTRHGHNGQFCSQNMQSFSEKDRKV